MAEPQIQYAKTSDGVNIAYSLIGDGPPLVIASSLWGTLHMRRSVEGWERSFDGFNRKLVFYDGRGTGASDHGTTDYSLSSQCTDLETVVDHLGIERFPLYAHTQAVPMAITFAVSHPKRVTRLVLAEGYAAARDWYQRIPISRLATGLTDMVQDDWESFTIALASAVTGYQSSEAAAEWAAACRGGMSPEEYLAYTEQSAETDVLGLLPQVTSQTLLVYFTDGPKGILPMMREIAANIPNASLAEASVNDSVEIVRQFLDEGDEADEKPLALPQGTAIILFLDIADSTELTSQLGDAAYRERERALDASLRSAIADAGGSPVEGKVLGDGIMAVFSSARQAIDAARACRDLGNEAGLPLHLGIHAGDVVREGNNIHGGAVQVAARVQGEAAAGEILVSQTVRDLARTSAGVSFEDRGDRELKGVSEPVRVFEVRAAT